MTSYNSTYFRKFSLIADQSIPAIADAEEAINWTSVLDQFENDQGVDLATATDNIIFRSSGTYSISMVINITEAAPVDLSCWLQITRYNGLVEKLLWKNGTFSTPSGFDWITLNSGSIVKYFKPGDFISVIAQRPNGSNEATACQFVGTNTEKRCYILFNKL